MVQGWLWVHASNEQWIKLSAVRDTQPRGSHVQEPPQELEGLAEGVGRETCEVYGFLLLGCLFEDWDFDSRDVVDFHCHVACGRRPHVLEHLRSPPGVSCQRASHHTVLTCQLTRVADDWIGSVFHLTDEMMRCRK